MKKYLPFIITIILIFSVQSLSSLAWGAPDSLKETYLRAFKLFEKAEEEKSIGRFQLAKEKFKSAQKILLTLKKENPVWQKNIVTYLIEECSRSISGIDETKGRGVKKQTAFNPFLTQPSVHSDVKNYQELLRQKDHKINALLAVTQQTQQDHEDQLMGILAQNKILEKRWAAEKDLFEQNRTENIKLKKENENLQKIVKDFQIELLEKKQLERSFTTLQLKRNEWSENQQKFQEVIQEREKTLLHLEESYNQLTISRENQIASLKKNLTERNQQFADLEKNSKELELKYKTENHNREALQKEIGNIKNNFDQSLKMYEREKEELKEELVKTEQALTLNQKKLAAIVGKAQALDQKLNEKEITLSEKLKVLNAEEEKNKSFSNQIKQLQDKVASLTDANQSQKEIFTAQATQSKEQFIQIENEKNNLSQEVARLMKSIESLKIRVAKNDSAKKTVEMQVSSLQKELDRKEAFYLKNKENSALNLKKKNEELALLKTEIQDVRELEERNATLDREVKNSKQRITALKQRAEEAFAEKAQYEIELAGLKGEFKNQKSLLSNTRNQFNNKTGAMAKLQVQLKKREQENFTLSTQKQNLLKKNELSQQKIATLKKQVEKSFSEKIHFETEYYKLKDQFRADTKKYEKDKSHFNTLLLKTKDDLNIAKKEKSEKTDLYEEQLSRFKRSIDRYEIKVSKIEKQKQSEIQRKEQLQIELKDLKKEIASLHDENNAVGNQYKQLSQKKSHADLKLTKLSDEKSDLEKRLKESHSQGLEQTKTLENLKKEYQAGLKQLNTQLSKDGRENHLLIKKYSSQIDQLKENKKRLELKLAESENLNMGFSSQVNDLKQVLLQLKNESEKVFAEKVKYQTTLSLFKKQFSSKEEVYREFNAGLQSKLTQKEREIEKIKTRDHEELLLSREKIRDLENQISGLEGQEQKISLKNKKLGQDLISKEKKIAEITKKYKEKIMGEIKKITVVRKINRLKAEIAKKDSKIVVLREEAQGVIILKEQEFAKKEKEFKGRIAKKEREKRAAEEKLVSLKEQYETLYSQLNQSIDKVKNSIDEKLQMVLGDKNFKDASVSDSVVQLNRLLTEYKRKYQSSIIKMEEKYQNEIRSLNDQIVNLKSRKPATEKKLEVKKISKEEIEKEQEALVKAIINRKQKQTDVAIGDVKFKHQAVLRYNKGVAFAEEGKIKLAKRAFEQAIELDPGFFEAHYNLARAYILSGKNRLAIQKYEQALAIKKDADIFFGLGSIYWEMKEWSKVIQNWEEVLKINPEHPVVSEWLPKAKLKIKEAKVFSD